MFTVDPSLTHLAAGREQIIAVAESVNQPHVAVPGKGPQSAKAFVTGIRNADASFSIYIYLLLTRTGEPVIYIHDQREFPLEDYRKNEAEALHFVESMGFLMENMNFRNLPPSAQDELLGDLPPFKAAASAGSAEEGLGGDEVGQRLARLLAAF